jgi:7-keto-8-aminopelargonate synthetase and related enzymes
MLALADRYDAVVYIDDAHGTGILGDTGAGTAEYHGVESPRLILMGTLSKAYGCIGGFVATDSDIVNVLRLGCSAFGFTSTLPPDQAECVMEAMDMVVDEPERRAALWSNQAYFVERMRAACFDLPATSTAIVPLRVGSESECARLASGLRDEGFHVDAILFPAVPLGEARLRFMMNAHHTTEHIDAVVACVSRLTRG